MRVNEGHVRFYEDDDDVENIPNKNWDMEDLFREALEQDVVYDDVNSTLKKKNRSARWIYSRINQVFLKGTEERIQAAEYSGQEEFALNAFDEYEEELLSRKNRISKLSVKNSPVLKAMLTSISLLSDITWKKSLIAYCGMNGVLDKTGDSFRLLTEFGKSMVSDIPKEELKQIIEDNKSINELIKQAQEDFEQRHENVINQSLQKMASYARKGYEEDFENKLRANLTYLLESTNTSNIEKKILGNGKTDFGWRIDEDDPQSVTYVDKKYRSEFKDELVQMRANVRNLFNIRQNEMLRIIGLKRNEYTKAIVEAIVWFNNSFGNYME